jgi:hypothetical protein
MGLQRSPLFNRLPLRDEARTLEQGMARQLFYVYPQSGSRWTPRWIVRKGAEAYGEYLSEAAAILDAVEAAQDAGSRGDEAHVVVTDSGGGARVEWSSLAALPIPTAVASLLLQEVAHPAH